MDTIRNYQRCSVMGDGELFKQSSTGAYPFHVIDISASGVNIRCAAPLDIGEEVKMDMRFSGHIQEIVLKVAAKVAKQQKIGSDYEYALRFKNLTNQHIVEIDEVVRRTCGVDSTIDFKHN